MPDTTINIHDTEDSHPYIDRGDGPPILFVHGAACDNRVWGPHVAYLEGRYRCIAPTLRWFGTSNWNGNLAEFGEKTHARDLIDIIETLDCGPVTLIGWSYGANVVLRLTVERPDLVSRVVAYEPSATSLVTDPEEVNAHQSSMRETFLPVTEAASVGDGLGVLAAFIDAVGGAGTFEQLPPEFRQVCLENAHSLIPLLNSKHRIESVTIDDLARLSMPVHVAWGKQSGKVWTIPSKAASKIANVRGHSVPGAGHIWPAKDPNGFMAWLGESGALGSVPAFALSTATRSIRSDGSQQTIASVNGI